MATQTLSAFGQQHVFKGIGRSTNYILASGSGSYVQTAPADESFDASGLEAGRKLLDFTSGIGVTNLGHCHPAVTKAAQKQCETIVHAQVNIGFSRPYLELIRALKPVMPHESLDSFFFWNSGAEAVEAAVKLARHVTKRQNIVTVQGSYHGRTFGTMAMTKSKTIYGAGFGPAMPGVFAIPFPYWSQMGYESPEAADADPISLSKQCLYQLELLLAQQSAPSDTAAIVLEPVLGEGGYVPAPKEFLEGLRAICDQHKILLVIDEVQSGFGRTGTYFACNQIAPGIKPDVLIMAKGIANGFPLSGIVTRKELSDLQPVGSMGGTYAGNAVSCAAGVACAKVMEDGSILKNVAERSKELFGALKEIQKADKTKHMIAEVRGLGLMVGVQFTGSKLTLPPRSRASDNQISEAAKIPEKIASRVQQKCLEKGMLVLTTSVYETIRFIPPLTVSQSEMTEGIRIIKEAIEAVAGEQ